MYVSAWEAMGYPRNVMPGNEALELARLEFERVPSK
jgi:hypothetical protein